MQRNDLQMKELKQSGRFLEEACSSDTLSSYSIQECLWAGKSDICDIVLARSPVYGQMLFLDKELQSAESDEIIYHEHLVHPILNATADTLNKRVLIVGGGEGATAREVLKWSSDLVHKVDWVDIDVGLVELCKQYLGWADSSVYTDPRLTFHGRDILEFLSEERKQYDCIILDLPDPDVDNLHLYGKDFWALMFSSLTPKGAIVTHTGPVAPGADKYTWREGLTCIQEHTSYCLHLHQASSYHVNIPSFQSEWGFWMSIPPSPSVQFPPGLSVLDEQSQAIAFEWPAYWFSNNVGRKNTNKHPTNDFR